MTLSNNYFAGILVVLCMFTSILTSTTAKGSSTLPIAEEDFISEILLQQEAPHGISKDSAIIKTPKKITAVLLTLALGPFGVHRLYMGTSAKVPVIYTLTLGGGLGILPLLDIVAILSSPSMEDYINNNKVVMWAK